MTEDFFERLAAPFPADAVSWRVGSTNQDKSKGLALAYLDARDIMDRLDLVCGPSRWQCRYTSASNPAVCEIGIYLPLCQGVDEDHGAACWEWVWKADGAGASDVEAEKGALSDALKRSAVRWGIGRYLYALPSPWVALEPAGRSWKIKDSEFAKLRALLGRYTGITPKKSAEAARAKDFEFFKEKIDGAGDLEALGSVGREIKEALPSLPVAFRDPIHDHYAKRLEALKEAAFPGDIAA